MSMSLTLRRIDPDLLEGLSNDDAVKFALNLPDTNAPEAEESMNFVQDWHLVHFLASGTDWDEALPAGFMIGGEYWVQADPEEEPFRLLGSDQVKQVNEHLSSLTDQTFETRLTDLSSKESRIYGCPIQADEQNLAKDAFEEIRAFFSRAAEKGQAISKAMS